MDYHKRSKDLQRELKKLMSTVSDVSEKKNTLETDTEVCNLIEEITQLGESVETIFKLIAAITYSHRENPHIVYKCSKVTKILLSIIDSCHQRATTPVHKQVLHWLYFLTLLGILYWSQSYDHAKPEDS
jgi:hypothetical protein